MNLQDRGSCDYNDEYEKIIYGTISIILGLTLCVITLNGFSKTMQQFKKIGYLSPCTEGIKLSI